MAARSANAPNPDPEHNRAVGGGVKMRASDEEVLGHRLSDSGIWIMLHQYHCLTMTDLQHFIPIQTPPTVVEHLQLARGQLHLRHRLHRVVNPLLGEVLGVLLRQRAPDSIVELIVRRIYGCRQQTASQTALLLIASSLRIVSRCRSCGRASVRVLYTMSDACRQDIRQQCPQKQRHAMRW